MFECRLSGWKWEKELQLVQADVRLSIDGETIIDEPLCVDVGMPALARSIEQDAATERFSSPEAWEKKPFFVCGCGDPECRAYSLEVRHRPDQDRVVIIEWKEGLGGHNRKLGEWTVSRKAYQKEVRQAVHNYLAFVLPLKGYQPLLKETVSLVQALVEGR